MNGDAQFSNKQGNSYPKVPSKYRMKRPFSMISDSQNLNQEMMNSHLNKKFKYQSTSDSGALFSQFAQNPSMSYENKNKNSNFKPPGRQNEITDIEMKSAGKISLGANEQKRLYNEKLKKEMSSYQSQLKRGDNDHLFNYDNCC